MTYYIHVNRGKIDSNRKHSKDDPVVKYQKGRYGKPIYCTELDIPGPSRVVASMHTPLLPCGARLVIETEIEPKVIR